MHPLERVVCVSLCLLCLVALPHLKSGPPSGFPISSSSPNMISLFRVPGC